MIFNLQLQLELFVIAIFIYKGNLELGTRTILILLCRVSKMKMVKCRPIGFLRLGKANSKKHTELNFTNLKSSRTTINVLFTSIRKRKCAIIDQNADRPTIILLKTIPA